MPNVRLSRSGPGTHRAVPAADRRRERGAQLRQGRRVAGGSPSWEPVCTSCLRVPRTGEAVGRFHGLADLGWRLNVRLRRPRQQSACNQSSLLRPARLWAYAALRINDHRMRFAQLVRRSLFASAKPPLPGSKSVRSLSWTRDLSVDAPQGSPHGRLYPPGSIWLVSRPILYVHVALRRKAHRGNT